MSKPNNKGNGKPSTKKNGTNRNSNRGNSGKPRNNGSRKSFNDQSDGIDHSTDNDVSYYSHIYPNFKDMASQPFNIVTGAKFSMLNGHTMLEPGAQPQVVYDPTTIGNNCDPGVMAIKVAPVLGDNLAANEGAQQIYTLIRKNNAGAINYDKTDVMMLILAMDSAYMLYAELKRMYTCINSYDYLSRYMPEGLGYALGFDIVALAPYQTQIRSEINRLAYALDSISIPNQFDFINRHSWLFSNIYSDSDGGRAQLYCFKPANLYKWTEGEDGRLTQLQFIPRDGLYGTETVSNVAQIHTAVSTLLTPLRGSEDAATISGDVVKAFGESGLCRLAPIDEGEVIKFSYNEEVLEQIMNMTWCCGFINPSEWYIGQDVSSLISGPRITQTCNFHYEPRIHLSMPTLAATHHYLLNTYRDPSPETVMVNTRLAAHFYIDDDNNLKAITGTEVVTGVEIWVRTMQSINSHYLGYEHLDIVQDMMYHDLSDHAHQYTFDNKQLKLLSRFKYKPTVYQFRDAVNGAGKYLYEGHFQDDNCIAIIAGDKLDALHEVAVTSEYAVKDFKTGITSGK